MGIRGVIYLFNGSSNTRGDFRSKFEELGGTILFSDDLQHDYQRTNVLDNANFFAEAYTTNTEYNSWQTSHVPREGFNLNNVMLLTFGINEDMNIYYYNDIFYPSLATLYRLDILDRYPPDM